LAAPNAFDTNSLSEKWYFFGCYMDWVGDFGSMLPSQQQTYTFPLVAQIDFPSAGITEGEDPMNSTKLARRDVVWISN
jgi:hypothetical protein